MIVVDGGLDTREGLSVVCGRMGYGGSRGGRFRLMESPSQEAKKTLATGLRGGVRNWRAYQVMGSVGHGGWSGEQLNRRPVWKRLSILAPT